MVDTKMHNESPIIAAIAAYAEKHLADESATNSTSSASDKGGVIHDYVSDAFKLEVE